MNTNRSQEEQMTNPFGISKKESKPELPSSGKPSASRRVIHYLAPTAHTLSVSRKGHKMGNAAKDSLYGAGAGAPGMIFGAGGAAILANEVRHAGGLSALSDNGVKNIVSGNPRAKAGLAMMGAGYVGNRVGNKLGRQHALTEMNRAGTLKKEVNKSDTVSAFGVDHLEPVSKISFKPVTQGFKAMKFGNAASTPKVVGRSYKAGIKGGQSKFNAGLQAAGTAIRHSPGTALAVGGTGVAGVGGAGYLMGRRKD